MNPQKKPLSPGRGEEEIRANVYLRIFPKSKVGASWAIALG
jgi:hypothetical protein